MARPRLRAAEQRAAEAGERRGDHDGLLGGGRVERLVRGDLAHDEDRDAVQHVEPGAGAEREQQPSRQPLGARPAREQSEQRGRRSPHREEDDDGAAAVMGELVERERVVHDRPWNVHGGRTR